MRLWILLISLGAILSAQPLPNALDHVKRQGLKAFMKAPPKQVQPVFLTQRPDSEVCSVRMPRMAIVSPYDPKIVARLDPAEVRESLPMPAAVVPAPECAAPLPDSLKP